ncbi:MAG: hypothetical protein Q8K99_13725 [Actinomycetota bacterium]|nr:hypothetical protein [Actinomycetota bacterium]
MKKWLGVALAIAVFAVIANDAGRYATTVYELSNITRSTASAAGRTKGSRETVGLAAAEYAATRGVTVYAVDIRGERVYVWTEMPLTRTWALARIMGVVEGLPAGSAFKVRSEANALRN